MVTESAGANRSAWLRAVACAAVVVVSAGWTAVTQSTARQQRVEPTVTLSVIGTNDLHGGVLPRAGRGGLSVFAGYLNNLRAARMRDGGAVFLIDAGDMFQGTLESNLTEGSPVVAAYNALQYTAAAIGNHEFDYGPVGEAATPQNADDDPRGALKARAADARFPFLAANIIDTSTGRPVAWPNVRPSVLVDVAGVKVGIVGLTTKDTLGATMALNTRGLAVAPLLPTIVTEATKLRSSRATVVIVTAHAGGRCTTFKQPTDLTSCQPDAEIVDVARKLPAGLVDLIVAGHTHAGIAHQIGDVAVIESYSSGRTFGRVDLTVQRGTGKVVERRIFEPQDVCARENPATHTCDPAARSGGALAEARYEGAVVAADPVIDRILAPAIERARALKEAPLGVLLETPIRRTPVKESPLGNLFADLMRQSVPGGDVAILQSGTLRADLPAGPLTYGELYEAMPFDNRLVELTLTGAQLKQVFATNLTRNGTTLSISGARVQAQCEAGMLRVTLVRESGRAVRDDEPLKVETSDFLATGGNGVFTGVTPLGSADLPDVPLLRDAMAGQLRSRGGRLRDDQLVNADLRRLVYPGSRPVRCGP